MNKPKSIKSFFSIDENMKKELQAIGFMKYGRGFISPPARYFIQEGINNFKASLTDKDLKIYNQIFENVQIGSIYKTCGGKRPHHQKYVKKKERGGV